MRVFVSVFLLLFFVNSSVYASDLLEVYKDSLISDPVFQQAMARYSANKENIAISAANFLPNISLDLSPSIYKSTSSGPGSGGIGSYSQRNYQMNLIATQNIFDYAEMAQLSRSSLNEKKAAAELNVAMQELIIRVASVYFAILQAQDNLYFAAANKKFYEKQLDQVILQYKSGLKTTTDISLLKASYALSVSEYIAAKIQLDNQRENLHVMTGKYYIQLAVTDSKMIFVFPQPLNINSWITSAEKNNWQIKAAEYFVAAEKKNKQIMIAGHFPSINAETKYNITYERNTGGTGPQGSLFQPSGSKQEHIRSVQLNLNIPVFSGGEVSAQVKQSDYQLQVAKQKLKQVQREIFNVTCKNYLAIISIIKQSEADKLALIAAQKSLEGLQTQYQTGLATLVDVLNQQEKRVNAERQYAADRYSYINNVLKLKQAIGTLSMQDVVIINSWLL